MAEERKSIDRLDTTGPAHVVAERWRKWRRSLEFFLAGQNITDPGRRHALLLHYAGTAVQDIHVAIEGDENGAERNVYLRTVNVLEAHFHSEPNTPFERYTFRQMSQQASEIVDQFAAHLRQQAQYCNFADLPDQLRDQLIATINNNRLRRKLLETRNIKLEEVLSTARAWEAVEDQLREMAVSDRVTVKPEDTTTRTTTDVNAEQVHAVRREQTGPEGACFNCGEEGHYARDEECPARGQKCSRCERRGHLEVTCRQPKQRPKETVSRARRTRVNFVEEDGGIDDYAF